MYQLYFGSGENHRTWGGFEGVNYSNSGSRLIRVRVSLKVQNKYVEVTFAIMRLSIVFGFLIMNTILIKFPKGTDILLSADLWIL